jgi:hypothetical protein
MSTQGPNIRKVAQRRSAQPGRRPEEGRQFQPANTVESGTVRGFGLNTFGDVETGRLLIQAATPGRLVSGIRTSFGPITALLHPPARRKRRPAPDRLPRPAGHRRLRRNPACRVHHACLSRVPASTRPTRDAPCRSPARSYMARDWPRWWRASSCDPRARAITPRLRST